MMNMEMMEQLSNNEEFMDRLAMVNSQEELQEVLAEYGVQITAAELTEALAGVTVGEDGELSEDSLDMVAGGGFFKNLWNKLKQWNTDRLGRLAGIN